LFAPLLTEVRERLSALSGGDFELKFALRRKLGKELSYDERGKPMARKLLKARKYGEQGGKCAVCCKHLPDGGKNAVLDREEAIKGYIPDNVKLICRDCDIHIQEQRRYK